MKKAILTVAAGALLLPMTAFGHGGGLDSRGGHNDRKNGGYHYHRKAVETPRPVVSTPAPIVDSSVAKTGKEIKQVLIRQSLSGYSGNCPCPYNTDRAGRKCGKRSAYSRPGGASPLCYESDVSRKMVDAYRTKYGVDSPEGEDVALEED